MSENAIAIPTYERHPTTIGFIGSTFKTNIMSCFYEKAVTKRAN